MKLSVLIFVLLGLANQSAVHSTPRAESGSSHNFTGNEPAPASDILVEMPSILDAYNRKAVLNFGEPCSHKVEMEFLNDVIAQSGPVASGIGQLESHGDRDRDIVPAPVHFEREKLLHGMKTLIQNSHELCDHKKHLTCHKDNKCGCGSPSKPVQRGAEVEAQAGYVLENGLWKSKLSHSPSPSPCPESEEARISISGSSPVADSTDFDEDSRFLTAQVPHDKTNHVRQRQEVNGTSFKVESARGQPDHHHLISDNDNVTSSSSLSKEGVSMSPRMYEDASHPNLTFSHKYSKFSDDSISTIMVCTHFFLLSSAIVIMMISFVLT